MSCSTAVELECIRGVPIRAAVERCNDELTLYHLTLTRAQSERNLYADWEGRSKYLTPFPFTKARQWIFVFIFQISLLSLSLSLLLPVCLSVYLSVSLFLCLCLGLSIQLFAIIHFCEEPNPCDMVKSTRKIFFFFFDNCPTSVLP